MTFWELFIEASLVVKFIMFFLVILSVYSWAIIIKKHKEFKKRHNELKIIKNKNNSKSNIFREWNLIATKNEDKGYFKNVIKKGILAINNSKDENSKIKKEDLESIISYMKESMEVAIEREIQIVKKNTNVLATIGSVSPYIGLLGTVWGIMQSFIAIGVAKQATLEYVAPSIAEALIATAIALFTAIPAYIFYNYYQNKLEELTEEYQLLTDEFCLIAKTNLNKSK
jgi:biopolymer transport protein TolQ